MLVALLGLFFLVALHHFLCLLDGLGWGRRRLFGTRTRLRLARGGRLGRRGLLLRLLLWLLILVILIVVVIPVQLVDLRVVDADTARAPASLDDVVFAQGAELVCTLSMSEPCNAPSDGLAVVARTLVDPFVRVSVARLKVVLLLVALRPASAKSDRAIGQAGER